MKSIFDNLVEISNFIVPLEIDGNMIPRHQDTIVMTLHNNLVFYNSYTENKKQIKRVVSYGLHAQKVVQSIDIEDLEHECTFAEITRIVESDDGNYYFLGYDDGLVQALSAVDLSKKFEFRLG